jgi:hypothetical protein
MEWAEKKQSSARLRQDRFAPQPATAARNTNRASAVYRMLAVQQQAGNQAVSQALARGRRASAPPPVMPVAPTLRRPSSPWRERHDARTSVQRQVSVQRFKNFSGRFKNRVDLETTAFAAAIGAPLNITKNAATLHLESQDYRPTGTVAAKGPKAKVGRHKLGWVQTVYESRRSFYYSPKGHKRSLGAKMLPSLLGKRKVVSDTLKTQPVRDGDAGVKPWYEINDAVDFDTAPASTKSVTMYDQPETENNWEVTVNGKQQYLVKTGGRDVFRTWLIVRNEKSKSIARMAYADWSVKYGTKITPNHANMSASGVAARPNSGGKVPAAEQGTGLKWPLLGDPVANDVAYDKEGWW